MEPNQTKQPTNNSKKMLEIIENETERERDSEREK